MIFRTDTPDKQNIVVSPGSVIVTINSPTGAGGGVPSGPVIGVNPADTNTTGSRQDVDYKQTISFKTETPKIIKLSVTKDTLASGNAAMVTINGVQGKDGSLFSINPGNQTSGSAALVDSGKQLYFATREKGVNLEVGQESPGAGMVWIDINKDKVVTTSDEQTIGSKEPQSGKKTFAGGASMNGRTLENVGTPGSATDAANKAYVDNNFAPKMSTAHLPNQDPVDTGHTWYDGRKIWRCVRTGTTNGNPSGTINMSNLPYFEKLVEINGVIRTSDGARYPVNCWDPDLGIGTATIVLNDNTLQFKWKSQSNQDLRFTNKEVVIEVYYVFT